MKMKKLFSLVPRTLNAFICLYIRYIICTMRKWMEYLDDKSERCKGWTLLFWEFLRLCCEYLRLICYILRLCYKSWGYVVDFEVNKRNFKVRFSKFVVKYKILRLYYRFWGYVAEFWSYDANFEVIFLKWEVMYEILRLCSQSLRLSTKFWGYITKFEVILPKFEVMSGKFKLDTEFLGYFIRRQSLRLPLYKTNSIIHHKWKKNFSYETNNKF